ncbi:MAG TPA: beta-ketoacyl-ACP synthase II [Spirochaetota bacterium]|mgnify:CR=1 FL=1|nr:beta-ketoacyl-ACP synthase II [Spirochaetota bacterium]HOM38066.1 beta-ketoacyl-ACP synthase II [Spirochaetota bacterium]HPQ48869.1 beta-ketoacyl-ACP synthase II [Spirochaetota bacterium]
MNKRVVITGMGIISPLGNNINEYWENLINGKSGVGYITKFNPEEKGISVKIAAEVKNFNPEEYIDKKEIRRMDLFSQYAMAAASQAIKQAGLEESNVDKERVGVMVGSGIGGIQSFQENAINFHTKGRVSPFFIPMVITDMAAGLISIKYGFMGPNLSISTACATSNHSILEAYYAIKRGDVDIMITGGAEAAIMDLAISGFSVAQALSRRNDEPTKASRPWDKNRDGFVMGEGAGIFVIESEESAKKRGAKILAEILGGGMSADAYHMTAPHPEGKGAALCMTAALKSAGLKPEDIQYVNAHGTSTELGDIAETNAIKVAFGKHAYSLKVNSTKSMIGHLLGAAGAAEAVACVMTLITGKVHPTINLDEQDPACDLDYVPNKAIDYDVKYALSNGFGFGGHNCSLVFGRYSD